ARSSTSAPTSSNTSRSTDAPTAANLGDVGANAGCGGPGRGTCKPRRLREPIQRLREPIQRARSALMGIFVDGREYPAAPEKNLLEHLLGLGIDLPYFCWHPAMGSVGACRQCAVKLY